MMREFLIEIADVVMSFRVIRALAENFSAPDDSCAEQLRLIGVATRFAYRALAPSSVFEIVLENEERRAKAKYGFTDAKNDERETEYWFECIVNRCQSGAADLGRETSKQTLERRLQYLLEIANLAMQGVESIERKLVQDHHGIRT